MYPDDPVFRDYAGPPAAAYAAFEADRATAEWAGWIATELVWMGPVLRATYQNSDALARERVKRRAGKAAMVAFALTVGTLVVALGVLNGPPAPQATTVPGLLAPRPPIGARLTSAQLEQCLSTMYSLSGKGNPNADFLRRTWDAIGQTTDDAVAAEDLMLANPQVTVSCRALIGG